MKQLVLELVQASQPTLDNFIAGRNAELLHEMRAMAEGRAAGMAIFMWGEAGSGRSHLLRSLVDAVRGRGRRAEYVPCADAPCLSEGLRRLDCVALDDVDRLAPAAQVDAFSLYNALKERGAVIATSGNAPPQQLELRHDLATRLGWGLVYHVHALSDEEKAVALQNHAAARGIRIPEDVYAYLLGRVRRDMGTLLAVLDALDRSSLAAKRAITLPFVRDWLQAAKVHESALRIED